VVAVSSNSTKSKVWQRRDFDIGASPFGLDVLPNGEKLHDGLFEMPLRFPGQYYDQETGTNYNYFRDYDPSIGRYIQSDPIGLQGGLNTYGYVGGNAVGSVDPLGLVTLGETKDSLSANGVEPGDSGFVFNSYTDTQIFDEWLRLERIDTSWLNELTPCPQTMDMCTADNGWHDPKSGVSQSFHRGGAFEVRSHTTPGNHSNQCIYDINGQLMTNIPAAGTADFRPCPIPGLCGPHLFHDVLPFNLSNDLGRVEEYYDVRPIK
jgi:RHS repeat-associated protein